MGFDADRALSDETYWFPKALYNDNDTFMLLTEDMIALNKYVWAGRLLPLTRDDYIRRLAISDSKEFSDPIWKEVDSLIGTYVAIKEDADAFHGKTWPDIVGLASQVYEYAQDAGRKTESSYYANMLDWVRQYHDELKKETPDQDTIKDLKDAITDITKKQIRSIDKLQGDRDTKNAMKNLLDGEDGEIAKLDEEIKETNERIKSINDEIAYDLGITKWALLIAFAGLVGVITAAVLLGVYDHRIKQLKESIDSLKALINSDNEKKKAAARLKADIHAMSVDIGSVVDAITPAIKTLEKLEGVWEAISGDLQGLHDLVSEEGNEIPPYRLELVQLNSIVASWNELAEYVDKFRQVAYLSEPKIKDIDTYSKELDDHLQKRESKE